MSKPLHLNARVFIAGHKGLVGSALVRTLLAQGYRNLILKDRNQCDLRDPAQVKALFEKERPEFVFLAAAQVGGIHANSTNPVPFLLDNLKIQNNIIEVSYAAKVERLLFLGSSCIYPRDCPQPIEEKYLLTSTLEPTNRPYALAKIAGIELCNAYNKQYGTGYLAVMPTNLYGVGDRYDVWQSHVIPALIIKIHEAKQQGKSEVEIWGTGKPLREFMYADDLAAVCVKLLALPEASYQKLLFPECGYPIVNIGSGQEMSIATLAKTICDVIGFQGQLRFNTAQPDGTPRKWLELSWLKHFVNVDPIDFKQGLTAAYADYCSKLGEPDHAKVPLSSVSL